MKFTSKHYILSVNFFHNFFKQKKVGRLAAKDFYQMESLQIKQRGKAQEIEECFYEATFKYFFAHKYTTGEWPRLTKEVTS